MEPLSPYWIKTANSTHLLTCVGGGNFSEGLGIALDGDNLIYVAGKTTSYSIFNRQTATPFPTTHGAIKTATGDPTGTPDQINGFFFQLDTSKLGTGQLLYSTYVGGDGSDQAHGIALDSSKNAYITGSTTSKTGFPFTSGAYQTTKSGTVNSYDAFMVKIFPDSTKTNDLKYATYFGGTGIESGNGIAVITDGTKVYFVGSTTSTDLPLSLDYQNTNNGGTDAFAAAINPAKSGSSDLIFSTYLGGTADDSANAVAVDANARCMSSAPPPPRTC